MVAEVRKVNWDQVRAGFRPREKARANCRARPGTPAAPRRGRQDAPEFQKFRALQLVSKPWTWMDKLPEIISSARAFFANPCARNRAGGPVAATIRSEEHTSELQSLRHLVCR